MLFIRLVKLMRDSDRVRCRGQAVTENVPSGQERQPLVPGKRRQQRVKHCDGQKRQVVRDGHRRGHLTSRPISTTSRRQEKDGPRVHMDFTFVLL